MVRLRVVHLQLHRHHPRLEVLEDVAVVGREAMLFDGRARLDRPKATYRLVGDAQRGKNEISIAFESFSMKTCVPN